MTTSNWEDLKRRTEEFNSKPLLVKWITEPKRMLARVNSRLSTIKLNFKRLFLGSFQRSYRGFSKYDLWNFDSYLATVIGKGLLQLAETTHGYPPEYHSFEEWQEDLREYGHRFVLYPQLGLTMFDEKYFKDALNFFSTYFFHLWD